MPISAKSPGKKNDWRFFILIYYFRKSFHLTHFLECPTGRPLSPKHCDFILQSYYDLAFQPSFLLQTSANALRQKPSMYLIPLKSSNLSPSYIRLSNAILVFQPLANMQNQQLSTETSADLWSASERFSYLEIFLLLVLTVHSLISSSRKFVTPSFQAIIDESIALLWTLYHIFKWKSRLEYLPGVN